MEWIELGELIKIRKGKKLDETGKTPDSIRMIMIEDLRGDMNYKHTNVDEKDIIVGERDIVIAWDGANAGTIGFNLKGAIGSTLARLSIQSENVFPKYLGNFLRSKFNEIRDKCTGATIPHVSRSHLISLKIPVPPMETQEKIVEVLDQAQALIDKRKEQIKSLDQLIESIFYKMFGDPVRNDKGWEVKELEKVAPIKSHSTDGGLEKVWLLNLDAIESNSGVLKEKMYVDTNELPNSINCFSNRHILYSKLRPYLNKVFMPNDNGYCTSELVPLLPNLKILNRVYLLYLLRSKPALNFLNTHTSGARMPRVVMKDFKRMRISIPPLYLQNEFGQKVQIIEKQKKLLEESLELLEENYKSIMDRAFKGQLFN